MDETTVTMTPPPPPVAPRPLRRSSGDRIFGGVCGGLGRYWNVDPVILRVAFGVSLLLGGFGLFAYLALWALVPTDTAPASIRVNDSWGLRILGAIAAFIAAMIGLGVLFSDQIGGGGVVLGALIAGVVVWIVLSQRGPQQVAGADVAPTGYAYGGDAAYQATQVWQDPAPPVAPRPRSYLGLIGLCASVAAAGVAMLLTDSVTAVLAAALLALGVTMLVGAFLGRAKWLLIFAIPLLMMLGIVSQVERADITTGEVRWSPTAQDTSYSLTAGTIDVDFSQWQGQPGDGDAVDIDMGLGEVRIAAPHNWDLKVVSNLGAGEVSVDGKTPDRPFTTQQALTVPASSGTADGTLTVRVTLRAGAVTIRTGAPAAGATLDAPQAPEKQDQKKKEKAA